MSEAQPHLSRGFRFWKPLLLSAMCLGVCCNRALAAPSADSETEKFIAKQIQQLDKLNDKFLADLQNREVRIQKSKMDPDFKQLSLSHIQQDVAAWKNGHNLPSADESADLVIGYCKSLEKNRTEIESFRRKLMQRTGGKNGHSPELYKLAELSKRLNHLISDGDKLTSGSHFHGTRQNAGGALNLHLHIKERVGNAFTGVLAEGANGNFDRMTVAGKTVGNQFFMQTTGMINGKNRQLNFNGYILGDRIVANLLGIATNGKQAASFVNLTRAGK